MGDAPLFPASTLTTQEATLLAAVVSGLIAVLAVLVTKGCDAWVRRRKYYGHQTAESLATRFKHDETISPMLLTWLEDAKREHDECEKRYSKLENQFREQNQQLTIVSADALTARSENHRLHMRVSELRQRIEALEATTDGNGK